MARRYARHDEAARTRYSELKRLARSQRRILAGTPGTLKPRSRNGTQYWVREYIRADGGKHDEHIGASTRVSAARLEQAREEIELARALAGGSSTLRLHGYQRMDRKAAAVLAVLFNHRLFDAGLVLVGSHAYGAILNELGVAAAAYRTRDLDLARGEALSLAHPDALGLPELLAETGLRFVAVPGMPSHAPSASYKLPGAEALTVDLLAVGKRTGEIVEVRELGAHAQAVQHLDYLTAEPLNAIVLSPNQVIPVRTPSPERFALHKLFSAQMRTADRDKRSKDLEQAALLAAATEEETPGALREAFRSFPLAGKAAVRRGAAAAARQLDERSAEAKDALLRIAGK